MFFHRIICRTPEYICIYLIFHKQNLLQYYQDFFPHSHIGYKKIPPIKEKFLINNIACNLNIKNISQLQLYEKTHLGFIKTIIMYYYHSPYKKNLSILWNRNQTLFFIVILPQIHFNPYPPNLSKIIVSYNRTKSKKI